MNDIKLPGDAVEQIAALIFPLTCKAAPPAPWPEWVAYVEEREWHTFKPEIERVRETARAVLASIAEQSEGRVPCDHDLPVSRECVNDGSHATVQAQPKDDDFHNGDLEAIAIDLWVRFDDNASDMEWYEMGDSIRKPYYEAAEAVLQYAKPTQQAFRGAVCQRCVAREIAGELKPVTTSVSYDQFEAIARAYWDTHPGCSDAKGTTKRMLFEAGITVDEREAKS